MVVVIADQDLELKLLDSSLVFFSLKDCIIVMFSYPLLRESLDCYKW